MSPDFFWKERSSETRYSRQELIAGWKQATLASASVLVVGAGALGNEVLKNLALTGVGQIDVADFDVVEISNLSRCVLFREEDLGCNKAEIAAMRLREMNPSLRCRAFPINAEHKLGAGRMRRYDLVLGAVDTIGARLALNRLCRMAGVPFLDGGMNADGGQVSLFHPHESSCYQCGMTESMWARVAQRNGCLQQGTGEEEKPVKLPATVTMAASIGAMQAQEAIRWLLRENDGTAQALRPGERICFQSAPYQVLVLQSAVRQDCEVHAFNRVLPAMLEADSATITASQLLDQFGAKRLVLDWDVIFMLECFDCSRELVTLPIFELARERLICEKCGRIRVPEMKSNIAADDILAGCTLRELGVPDQAILELVLRDRSEDSEGCSIFAELCGEHTEVPNTLQLGVSA